MNLNWDKWNKTNDFITDHCVCRSCWMPLTRSVTLWASMVSCRRRSSQSSMSLTLVSYMNAAGTGCEYTAELQVHVIAKVGKLPFETFLVPSSVSVWTALQGHVTMMVVVTWHQFQENDRMVCKPHLYWSLSSSPISQLPHWLFSLASHLESYIELTLETQ